LYRLITFTVFIACLVWFYVEPGFEPFVGILAGLAAYFRDEVHGVIGSNFMSLTTKASLIHNFSNSKYSFIDEEYINPKILADLIGWLSDSGDQVTSINIPKSNQSNRYYGQVTVSKPDSGFPIVQSSYDESTNSYQYIGCSFSGVHILRTWNSSIGGSGIFCDILLVTISNDNAISYDNGRTIKFERLIIKKIGSLPLGDRYDGNIAYKFGFLSIPACKGMQSMRRKKTRLLVL
jgi:hypothetical protein